MTDTQQLGPARRFLLWSLDHVYVYLIAGAAALYISGYFDSYWIKHKSVYDPKLGVNRCVDKDSGELMDIDPPCLVLTLKGRSEIEKRQKKCEDGGGNPGDCFREAFDWVASKAPGNRNPNKKGK